MCMWPVITLPRRTVFDRDDAHGLKADFHQLNVHLDAATDDDQVQEDARGHLCAPRHGNEATAPTLWGFSLYSNARTESDASGVSTTSILRSAMHARPPIDTPKLTLKPMEPPSFKGGGV